MSGRDSGSPIDPKRCGACGGVEDADLVDLVLAFVREQEAVLALRAASWKDAFLAMHNRAQDLCADKLPGMRMRTSEYQQDYECAVCSAKPGTPLLCDVCLDRRGEALLAGRRWMGPRRESASRTYQDVGAPSAPTDTLGLSTGACHPPESGPKASPAIGSQVRICDGPHTGATGRLDFIDAAGARALVDCGECRGGGLTWAPLEWVR